MNGAAASPIHFMEVAVDAAREAGAILLSEADRPVKYYVQRRSGSCYGSRPEVRGGDRGPAAQPLSATRDYWRRRR